MEMEKGGKLFFDLFVAMCNHMVCPFPNVAGLGRVAGLLSDWELWLMVFRMMFSRLCRFAVLLRQGSDRDWYWITVLGLIFDGCIDGGLAKLETKARLYFFEGVEWYMRGVLSVVLRRLFYTHVLLI